MTSPRCKACIVLLGLSRSEAIVVSASSVSDSAAPDVAAELVEPRGVGACRGTAESPACASAVGIEDANSVRCASCSGSVVAAPRLWLLLLL
jgi:hypothetical protein